MTDEELKIKESELKYAIGNLVDNLISYKRECDNQADRIAELEKENAELKEQLESERDLPAIAYMQGAEKQKKKDEEQITKAKVALRNVVDYLGQFCSDYPDCVIEAEQFLNEVEK